MVNFLISSVCFEVVIELHLLSLFKIGYMYTFLNGIFGRQIDQIDQLYSFLLIFIQKYNDN